MLQPNRRKFRKEHKGRNTGVATRGADATAVKRVRKDAPASAADGKGE